MPVSLAKIASQKATVTFMWEEETVTLTYIPGRVTEKMFAQAQMFLSLSEETIMESFASLNEMLAHLITAWDVYEDEAQTVMFPLDAARMAELPIFFRVKVFTTIMSDMRPEALAPTTQN
jgi:hypothetical protein